MVLQYIVQFTEERRMTEEVMEQSEGDWVTVAWGKMAAQKVIHRGLAVVCSFHLDTEEFLILLLLSFE
jgi:hypothetical protein